MKTKTLLASLALTGLMIAQPVSAATASINSLDGSERIGSLDGEAERLGGNPWLVILLVFLAVGGLIVAVTDGSDPVSP